MSFEDDGNIKEESKLVSTLLKQNTRASRLVVPGSICHTYSKQGQTRCSLINHRHPCLRRIEAYSTCTRDHYQDSVLLSLREVFAARSKACVLPPQWECMRTDADVRCSVCKFHVSWSVTGKAATETARATHHCRACGKIVCKDCSKKKITTLQYLDDSSADKMEWQCKACPYGGWCSGEEVTWLQVRAKQGFWRVHHQRSNIPPDCLYHCNLQI